MQCAAALGLCLFLHGFLIFRHLDDALRIVFEHLHSVRDSAHLIFVGGIGNNGAGITLCYGVHGLNEITQRAEHTAACKDGHGNGDQHVEYIKPQLDMFRDGNKSDLTCQRIDGGDACGSGAKQNEA